MRQSARVLSTDALREFRSALAKYSAKGRDALRAALMDVRHSLDWLEAQLKAWTREADKRNEEVNRCRADLAVVRSAPEGWRSAATEREIDLRKAQARLREAEEKVTAVQRWRRMLPQALTEYELPMRRLGGFLDGDVRHALAVLDAKIQALDDYAALEAPAGPATPHPNPPPQGGREKEIHPPPQGGREQTRPPSPQGEREQTRSPSPLAGEGWGGGDDPPTPPETTP